MECTYDLTNEIQDEIWIGVHCTIQSERHSEKEKIYKIYTLDYNKFINKVSTCISESFSFNSPYNISNEFIDDFEISTISFNVLYILLHSTSDYIIASYINNIFDSEYSFSILSKISEIDLELREFLKLELGFDFFTLDSFNIHDKTLDLIVKGK